MVSQDITEPPGARPLLIFPCNGNGLEALDCLGDAYRCVGFVDDTPAKQSAGAHGFRVLDRRALARHPDAAVLAVPGGPASYRTRQQVVEGLGVARDRLARVIHPSARVSPLAQDRSPSLTFAPGLSGKKPVQRPPIWYQSQNPFELRQRPKRPVFSSRFALCQSSANASSVA